MTTNESSTTAPSINARMLASTISDIFTLIAEIDHTARFDATDTIDAICASYDICPMHACDAQICRDDDESSCASLIN